MKFLWYIIQIQMCVIDGLLRKHLANVKLIEILVKLVKSTRRIVLETAYGGCLCRRHGGHSMRKDSNFYLVDNSVLPEIFSKVIMVKEILARGHEKSINSAVNRVGISRSAFYKYKDFVFPFYELSQGKVMTILFTVEHMAGVLSDILNKIASVQGNVLSINQNLPINGMAHITISVDTQSMTTEIKSLMDELKAINGIMSHEILAGK